MVRNTPFLILLVSYIKGWGYRRVAILQTPDYNGGHTQELIFSTTEDFDWVVLKPFEYIIWEGTPIDLIKEMPTLDAHFEPFHAVPYNREWNWFEDSSIEEMTKQPMYDDFFDWAWSERESRTL